MPAMRKRMRLILRRTVLGAAAVCVLGCAGMKGPPGYSIEAATGNRTGNPFEIRLTASGSDLKAVLVNLSSTPQRLLCDANLQTSTLELVSSTGSEHKPYDSRRIMKYDTTAYCGLFQPLAPGKKLVLGSVRFRKSRDGFAAQWGPLNFEELPAGDYQAVVSWRGERAQCLDESTQQMRKLPTIWRGFVRSNQVTLRLR
jgi:hypothetical protein